MGHSIGDGIIVAAAAAAVIAYFYFKHKTKQRRLELVHQERLAAMDKGIPLPELPIDPSPAPSATEQAVLMIHGIIWTALSLGAMIVLYFVLSEARHTFWVAPLPLAFMGIGLILAHAFTRESDR